MRRKALFHLLAGAVITGLLFGTLSMPAYGAVPPALHPSEQGIMPPLPAPTSAPIENQALRLLPTQTGGLLFEPEPAQASITSSDSPFSLSCTGDYLFAPVTEGLPQPEPYSVTISAPGLQPTGDLEISLLGDADAFTVSAVHMDSLQPGESGSFTVQPAAGLPTGHYASLVVVSSPEAVQGFTVSINVGDVSVTSASLYPATGLVFPLAQPGYDPLLSQQVTLTNTGTLASGTINVQLSGLSGDCFELSSSSLGSLQPGEAIGLSVAPKSGLPAGFYQDTLTFSNGNDLVQTCDIQFTVQKMPEYHITLSASESTVFPALEVGYTDAGTVTVSVFNDGLQPTGPLSIQLEGSYLDAFRLSTAALPSLMPGETAQFQLSPGSGLPAGSYFSTLLVSGENGILQSLHTSVEVTEKREYLFKISPWANYSFQTQNFGYTPLSPKVYTVKNSGNMLLEDISYSLSGPGASAFVLSSGQPATLPVNATTSFTVAPALGLAPGVYQASLTVSARNTSPQTILLSFIVQSVQPDYRISVTPEDRLVLPTIAEGEPAVSLLKFTLRNTGNKPTGPLFLRLSGLHASSFSLQTTLLSDLAPESANVLSISAKEDLAAGLYQTTLEIIGSNGIYLALPVSLTVSEAPVHSIALSPSVLSFPPLLEGYSSVQPGQIMIKNTGNQVIDLVSASLAGPDADKFSLSAALLFALAPGSSTPLRITPAQSLSAGNYSATLNLYGSNGIAGSLSIQLTVKPAASQGIILTPSDILAFPEQLAGYAPLAATNIQLKNTGSAPTGTITCSLTGQNPDNFVLSTSTLSSLSAGEVSSLGIRPANDLPPGRYTATLLLQGAQLSATLELDFQVSTIPVISSILTLHPADQLVFPRQTEGYSPLSPAGVEIKNSGSIPSGAITLRLSGEHSGSFVLSSTQLDSLAPGESRHVKISPLSGLAAGHYTALLTLSGGDESTLSLPLEFEVLPALSSGIFLNPSADKTFVPQPIGYLPVASHNIKVQNTGEGDSGSLSLSLGGPDKECFLLSASSLPSLAPGRNGSFTVQPKTGLPAGNYTASLTVHNAGGIQESISLHFSVFDAPVLHILPDAPTTLQYLEGEIDGTLTAQATTSGNEAIQYLWYITNANNTLGGSSTGVASSKYAIPEYLSPGTYYFFAEASSIGSASVRSAPIKVIVLPKAPSAQPTSLPEVLCQDSLLLDISGNQTFPLGIRLGSGSGLASSASLRIEGNAAEADTLYLEQDSNVTLSALQPGTARLLVDFSGDGMQQYNRSITIQVIDSATQPAPQQFILSAFADTGGCISPAGSSIAAQGSSHSFQIAPFSGYSLRDVQIDGTSVGPVPSYTFDNIGSNHSIQAFFSPVAAPQPTPVSITSSASQPRSTTLSTASNSLSEDTPADSSSASSALSSLSSAQNTAPTPGQLSENPPSFSIGEQYDIAAPEGSLRWDESVQKGSYDPSTGTYHFEVLSIGDGTVYYTNEQGGTIVIPISILDTPVPQAAPPSSLAEWPLLLPVLLALLLLALVIVLIVRRKKRNTP